MEFLARLEANGLSGSDVDLGSCSRIAADTGLACADAEHAESAQFDALAGSQSLFETFEDSVDSRLGFWYAAGPCARPRYERYPA